MFSASKLTAAAALCAACVCGFSASASAEDNVLRVGAEPAYAPFEFMDEQTKTLTGFDIELIDAIAKAEGYTIEVSTMPFDALIPALMTNTIDVALSAITITEERQKRVSFSDPYYESGLTILIREGDKDKIKSENDLQNQHICVQIGTTGAYYSEKVPGAVVTNFNSAPESYLELKAGGCIAAINDKPVNDYYLATTKSSGIISLPGTLSAENYGIAIRKGNEDIVNLVNAGFDKIKADGTYEKLYQKWFKSEPSANIMNYKRAE